MNYLIFHDNTNSGNHYCDIQHLINTGGGVANVLLKEMARAYSAYSSQDEFTLAVPDYWSMDGIKTDFPIVTCSESLAVASPSVLKKKTDRWVLLSNAGYVTGVNPQWLTEILTEIDVDVTCVDVDPDLTAFREKIRISSQGDLIGIRRHYDNSARLMAVPDQWPPHVFIKANKFNKIISDNTLPLNFAEFIARCRRASLNIQSVSLAGTVENLDTESGLLSFAINALNDNRNDPTLKFAKNQKIHELNNHQGRIFGQVITGHDTRIEPGAIVVGPAVLGDRVVIEKNAVVRSSIVGSDVTVPEGFRIENRIALDSDSLDNSSVGLPYPLTRHCPVGNDGTGRKRFYFRTWRWFSYGGIFKRLADIVFSLLVLLLFLPVFPILAAIIKITYPGPIFFGHSRQGRYGKEFKCIKFRTMMVGADDIQARLRIKNQVDGPQFKMEDDPRVTPMGKFLRDTCIDEIPQFINVLLGQMSVVGPRPSPEKENAFCAYWRDARLSVRPGITGMWQVCRTRDEGQDFQEWVLHDTKYVKNLSLSLDIWICWKTVIQLVKGFMRKF